MLRNIAVIGAGVSGLTAGYALKKIGLEVEIFERSQSIDAFGAGITLSKNATLLLQDLDLWKFYLLRVTILWVPSYGIIRKLR